MVTAALHAVGFCAHYSEQGDWAFDYALELSRRHEIQLNVFHFLADPYDPEAVAPTYLSATELRRLTVERERELRMYYDERAGDYLEVGQGVVGAAPVPDGAGVPDPRPGICGEGGAIRWEADRGIR